MKIGGLTTPAFSKAVDNIRAIDNMFARNFKEGTYVKWAPGEGDKDLNVSASNRIFTLSDDASQTDSTAIPNNVDPTGALQAEVDKGQLRHLDDNVVKYYERIVDVDGSIS